MTDLGWEYEKKMDECFFNRIEKKRRTRMVIEVRHYRKEKRVDVLTNVAGEWETMRFEDVNDFMEGSNLSILFTGLDWKNKRQTICLRADILIRDAQEE